MFKQVQRKKLFNLEISSGYRTQMQSRKEDTVNRSLFTVSIICFLQFFQWRVSSFSGGLD